MNLDGFYFETAGFVLDLLQRLLCILLSFSDPFLLHDHETLLKRRFPMFHTFLYCNYKFIPLYRWISLHSLSLTSLP